MIRVTSLSLCLLFSAPVLAGPLLTGVVSAVVVVLSGAHRIRSGAHWATDVIAGVLIGGALVLVATWIMGHERWHRRCHHCPWGPEEVDALPLLVGAVPVSLGTSQVFRLFAHLAFETDAGLDQEIGTLPLQPFRQRMPLRPVQYQPEVADGNFFSIHRVAG